MLAWVLFFVSTAALVVVSRLLAGERSAARAARAALRDEERARREAEERLAAERALEKKHTRAREDLEAHLRTLQDDLAKKQAEFEAQVEALESATRHKSEFLANMSHELRTPLNAVLGFSGVLRDGSYGALNAKQRECIEDVVEAGQHLLALINDVLDLSKIEAGRMELSLHSIDLAEVVADAVKLVRPHAAERHVQVEDTVAEGAFFVRADMDRVKQVLCNLLSNAVKFSPGGGTVKVHGAVVAGFVRISVTDHGIGIAAADQAKLFHEFSQVDGSITRRFGGTGLGLTISRRLAEIQGGRVDFESREGRGSTFWLELPLPPRATPPTFSRRTTRSRPGAPSVLVVDGDAASQRLVESFLAEAGIGALSASTLEEARQLSAMQSLEVVVIDPLLHDTQLEDVSRFVSARFGPRVVVSSLAPRNEVTRGLPQSMFVEKPIVRARLLERVRVARRLEKTRVALVVEPNEDDLAMVRTLLVDEGFEVRVAHTVSAARSLLGEQRPAVAIVEVAVDGGEVLVADIASTGAPVVVLTGLHLDDTTRLSLASQARLVLRKGHLSREAFQHQIVRIVESRKRILAVDDNEQNLRLITTLLASRGYDILEARDATSALSLARSAEPDVILMDVMLPDLDGLTATRKLKTHAKTRSIPVIAVTAQAMAGDAERAREAGCADHIPKPIDRARLLAAIERALADHPHIE